MLGWLKDGLDEYHLERLRKRWRFVKGVDQERWIKKDWSWWQSGDMISWMEVFPDDINIISVLGDDSYLVDDMYCINPGCSCKEAGLHFSRITTGAMENLGAISVSLPSGRFSGSMGEEGNETYLKRLWEQLRKRPGILGLLRERHRRIKPIGQEIVRLSKGYKNPMSVPAREKPGRNEPCPCGSGKKSKKCCSK
ncbi:MAG: SEC-C metal-binding domain-containing protein [Syntrophobacteraceae bacterium]